jgi:hypothetical protein
MRKLGPRKRLHLEHVVQELTSSKVLARTCFTSRLRNRRQVLANVMDAASEVPTNVIEPGEISDERAFGAAASL